MLIFLSRKSSNFFYIFLMYMCEFFENFFRKKFRGKKLKKVSEAPILLCFYA